MPTPFGPIVTLPGGDHMKATHETSLEIPQLSSIGNTAYLFPKLKSANLLSIGQFCDDGCLVLFHKDIAIVAKHNKIILHGVRNKNNGMWVTTLPNKKKFPHLLNAQNINIYFSDPTSTQQQHIANGIITKETSINDLINFLHAVCFSPSPSTWIEAIKRNYFITWPGSTAKAVRKYLTESPATAKGHLDQIQKNQQSSKSDPFALPPEMRDNIKHQIVSTAVVPITTGKIFTDQTGQFPVQSETGNKYVFVLYDYNSNAILAEPIKNRKGQSLIDAFIKLTNILISKGLQPKFQILDNEASFVLKQTINKQQIKFQLAPPNIHRRNAAERAIRTFKNHFTAGPASIDPSFPMHQWGKLINQAVITLNILRPARLNPTLLAYSYLFGLFNYSATPLTPPGIKCQIHEKPKQRASWDPHSADGFYLGPALEHYRCHKVFVNKTNKQRISDTVAFFPTKIRMPETSALEKATQAAEDLISVLQNPEPKTPFLTFGKEQHTALQQLAELFKLNLESNRIKSPIQPMQPANNNNDAPSSSPTQTPSAPRVPNATPPQPPAAPRVTQQLPPPPRTRRVSFHPNVVADTITQPLRQPQSALRRSPRLRRLYQRNLLLQLATSHKYKDFAINHLEKKFLKFFAQPVLDPSSGKSMEYRDLIKHADPTIQRIWALAMCEELGHFAQGYKNNGEATDCIDFIHYKDIPLNKKATYAHIVAEIREQKKDPNRIRITVGGNLIHYPYDKSQPTADLTTVKLHLNNTISTPNARYACLDIKNMYLMSIMQEAEYMFIDAVLVPQDFIDEYQLHNKIHNGKIYIKIKKGMYGLPQAGKLAYDQLKNHLKNMATHLVD